MKKTQRGPGRPMATIHIPNKRFTFGDLAEANKHVTPLTLRKFLKRDAARKGKSEICLVKDETREPNSKSGLGRKTFVYIRRTKLNGAKTVAAAPKTSAAPKATRTLKSASKSNVTVALNDKPAAPAAPVAPVTPVAPEAPVMSDYEAKKAALLGGNTAVVPAATPVPSTTTIEATADGSIKIETNVPHVTPAAPVAPVAPEAPALTEGDIAEAEANAAMKQAEELAPV